MNRYSLTLLTVLVALLVTGPLLADQKWDDSDKRFVGVASMQSTTSSSVIGTSNKWSVAAAGSGYTDPFTLNGSKPQDITLVLSVTAVNSGTHVLYLQGSNNYDADEDTEGQDDSGIGTFANIYDCLSVSASDGTTTAVMGHTASQTKFSFSATGDYAISFKNVPPFKHYRWHLDADAANGPVQCDEATLGRW